MLFLQCQLMQGAWDFWIYSKEKILYGKVSKLASNDNHMNINVVIAVIFKMVKNFTWLKSAESSPSTYNIPVPIPLILFSHTRKGGGRKYEGNNGRGK
jgi:hypothetical protein